MMETGLLRAVYTDTQSMDVGNIQTWHHHRYSEKCPRINVPIGVYLGEVIIANYKDLLWEPYPLTNDGEKVYDFGHPSITGFKSRPGMYPMGIVNNIAGKIIEGRGNTDSLRDTYNFWVKKGLAPRPLDVPPSPFDNK
jgi:hypothetical protein